MTAVCLTRNNLGQFCEKPNRHTGNHRCRMFTASEAEQAFVRQQHAGDPRWSWVNGGWQTTDPQLVGQAMKRLKASRS
jgi:hypothetical protein